MRSREAVDVERFRDTMANVAMSVAVVTVVVGTQTRGVTIGSLISLSLDPPLVLFALKRSSSMLAHLDQRRFGITLLSSGQAGIAARLAASARSAVPAGWLQDAGVDGAGTLRGGAAWLQAWTSRLWPIGDHVVVVAHVLDAAASQRAPLLYHRRAYRAVGP